ncbi:hypothetical protein CO724_10700 [Ectopseudomonas mendocina]|nr:hypothetical protein CO724_10700 [Pseudomonas mendocina]
MSLIPKIATFYACLWVVLWLLRRRPNSWLSRLAFSWNGPFPQVGERRSQFRLRQSLFALSWLLQILLVSALLALAVCFYEPLQSEQSFQVVSAFALTIGAGMASLSAAYCFLASLKASVLGPDPAFELLSPDESDSEPPEA